MAIHEVEFKSFNEIETVKGWIYTPIREPIGVVQIVHGYDATSHPDALLVAIAADESLMLESTEYFVDIETAGNLTRGYNLVDKEKDLNKEPNVRVCEKADSARFKEHLMEVLEAIN